MTKYLDQFIATATRSKDPKEQASVEVITVSETVSKAASVYELIRNTLEFDEDHRLRRNAIRRFFKRRFGEEDLKKLSADLLYELIWARYLPNKKVSFETVSEIQSILVKYKPLFDAQDIQAKNFSDLNLWLLDLLSTEIEYHLQPPKVEEALASLAYQDLRERVEWTAMAVKKDDQDLQLFIAVHKAILKSNLHTLRFRIFCLYYPHWTKSPAHEEVREIADQLQTVVATIEKQINHPAADKLFRFVQGHTIVYHILSDLVLDDPQGFKAVTADEKAFNIRIAKAAAHRYDRFRTRVTRTIVRAAFFLIITKFSLAIAVELPYDALIAHTTTWLPLIINILFPPILLVVIGFSARSIPERRNTEQIQKELAMVLGKATPTPIRFKMRQPWSHGLRRAMFNVLYFGMLVFSIVVIAGLLSLLNFNVMSTGFFLFFLSLVMFFGLKIRGTRRELVLVEGSGTMFGTAADVFFLPIVRVGRWMSLKAPRVNIFLFFLDFIVEAPFKAAIKLIEGWLAFLREKKEEI